ncbi:hypothetical protein XSR1_370038 [Xenorhabdus szentirmaii DSM 16338]|uniref:Uncharacterized protein n=1 Tax=Xenorhabdus szentirmaii DSM 16338 TaxID=1427518 RepID=W1IZE1_9GAMM|nr:hypothetical protein XSR1_370038 [Xenorhabdus szentirmaii DSM 16338]
MGGIDTHSRYRNVISPKLNSSSKMMKNGKYPGIKSANIPPQLFKLQLLGLYDFIFTPTPPVFYRFLKVIENASYSPNRYSFNSKPRTKNIGYKSV